MNDNILGKRLKSLREDSGMSRAELSLQLNTSISAISQYETGSRIPSDDIKIAIAKIFNVSVDYLLGLTPFTNTSKENTLFEQIANLNNEEIMEIKNFIHYMISKHK